MEEQKKNNARGSQPVDRLFRIIEFLAASRLPMRMAEIASAMEMPQPTVLRAVPGPRKGAMKYGPSGTPHT